MSQFLSAPAVHCLAQRKEVYVTDFRFNRTLSLLLLVVVVAGCATVSFDEPKPYSETITDTADTRLGKSVSRWVDTHGGLSAFYPLSQGMDALGVRLRLAEVAEKSIDLQYFLMKNDTTGRVMANALLKAADRGVRIRFLLDDIFTSAPDRGLLLIDQHPNIEVRLFNPISRRGFFTLNFLGDFRRANRRMHNKSFTVDNQISIIGGRNLADEYFELKKGLMFVDFDVIALGPIAAKISASFDEFWNHSRAVPIDQIAANKADEDIQTVRADIAEEFDGIYDTVYKQALDSHLLQDLMADRQPMFLGEARVLSDSPDKLINEISEEQMRLATDLREVLLSAEKEIIFLSPYYVPGDGGVQFLRNLIHRGVRVIILTNSLASNNHVAVHGGYARYRKEVIKAGTELYEARANAVPELRITDKGTSEGSDEGTDEDPDALTLHTKAFLIDRRYLFVGSLNLDPRSIRINAEIGLLIDSQEMAEDLAADREERLANIAYRVLLNDKGALEWHGRINGEAVIETKEPLTSLWLRIKAWFLRIVPDSQL
jgi:putative cardiolipin synthase